MIKATNQLPNLQYLPLGKLDYQEPEAAIVCVWGYTTWDLFHSCYVRGVPVSVFGATIVSDDNRCYRKCMYPDGSVQVVNEGNIRIKKVNRYGNHPLS